MVFNWRTAQFINERILRPRGVVEDVETTVLRFRPNIVIDVEGVEESEFFPAFCEDAWVGLSVNGEVSSTSSRLDLKAVKSCGRCSHIFVNPRTCQRDAPFLAQELKKL